LRLWAPAPTTSTGCSRAPHLLDKQLPFRHCSREAMFSSEARARWVEPDLRPLPF
jgi:hypothetical protein